MKTYTEKKMLVGKAIAAVTEIVDNPADELPSSLSSYYRPIIRRDYTVICLNENRMVSVCV